MQLFCVQLIGDPLRPCPVGNVDEGIVQQSEIHLPFAQPRSKPVMPVEIDLQTAGQPGRHAHVAQAQFLVDEVEVIMQALAVVGLQKSPPRLLVMPRLIG